MTKIKFLAAAAIAASLLLGAQSAQAHCDAIDGPVATAAQKALDTDNVNLALPYAPAAAEAEIKAAFAQAREVRGLGADAHALADRAFIETTVRLHRAGEGAPYTGLKPAGIDHGAAIAAAERAVGAGTPAPARAFLVEELEHGLHARFAAVEGTRNASREPIAAKDVPAARARASAELGFVTFVEGLRQAIHGGGAHAHGE
jgi:hypothetical protein